MGRPTRNGLTQYLKTRGARQRSEVLGVHRKMASKLMSNLSFHLEKSRSATTATTNDCTVLNRH
uniref:Uncharacterized protein n=1 Tax=Oryza rufipogon TaxID=4529 RepID=A0A0E0R3U9_ORYRU